MSTVLRRSARSEVALAVAVLLAMSGAIGPVRAVHPGTDAGLTVPTGDTIRQSPGLAATYELDIAGADDVAWSPAGRYLAYTVPDGPAPGLYVTDGAGCFIDRLTTNPADRAPAFDGATLYFTRGDATLEFGYSLYGDAWSRTANPSPSGWEGTDVSVSVIEGYWAYVLPPGAADPDDYVLQVARLFAGTITPVFQSPDPIRGTEWSPDGSLLAFEATVADGSTEIHVADLTGEIPDVTTVTNMNGSALDPSFSPDGDSLAFVHWVPGAETGVVRVMDVLGSGSSVVRQGATGGLDWRSDNVPAGIVPIETATSISLDDPAVVGINEVTISVSPAPAEGIVRVSVDGSEQFTAPLEDGTGEIHTSMVLPDGTHELDAEFLGACPHRSSSDSLMVEAPAPTPEPTPIPTAAPTPTPAPTEAPRSVVRTAGSDRYATAAAVSKLRFPNPAASITVFVASGTNFPDALTAGPAAGAKGAPILLVRPDSIPTATRSELDRLGPAKIYLVGGTSAVSDVVKGQLRQYTDSGTAASVVRVAGANRFATAEAVAKLLPAAGSRPTVFIATGADFPDALAAGPAATKLGVPILLVERNRVPPETARELARLSQPNLYVIGGSSVISESVRLQLAAYTDDAQPQQAIRLSGADRFLTNVAVVKRFWTTSVARSVVANGLSFPDALSQGPYPLPIHLVRPDAIGSAVEADIRRLGPARIDVIGGTAMVSNGVVARLRVL